LNKLEDSFPSNKSSNSPGIKRKLTARYENEKVVQPVQVLVAKPCNKCFQHFWQEYCSYRIQLSLEYATTDNKTQQYR
jgi:hypothetical protein